MTIAWNAFTPGSALAGGVLIGLAAALFALFNGRIAGIAGIVGGLFAPKAADLPWRLAFIAGLVGAPWLYRAASALPTVSFEADYDTLILAGLIVGIGTRYGSGCTSGHGVCGLSRLSPRSMVATGCFMTAGFVTVYFLRHVIGA